MALDASAQRIIDLLAQANAKPIAESSPTEARAAMANLALLGGEGAPVASVEHRDLDGVPVIVVTPTGSGPFPVFVWIHGGGWVIGTADESLASCRNMAVKANCVVVSVDYRLAPEHKAPAATDDCRTAIDWVLAHAAEIGGRADAVAVGGDSAGGNLAALMALHYGDRLRHQALVYPATDLTMSHPSIDENAEGFLLTKAAMLWFGEHYLAGTSIDPRDPSVSPYYAPDEVLADAASATVITAGYDPLRDEGEAYAQRLVRAGVEVTQRRFGGQIHAFFSMPAAMPEAVEAEDLIASRLRLAFAD